MDRSSDFINMFGEFLNGYAPTVGLQVMKLAMLTLSNEGFDVKCLPPYFGTSSSSLSPHQFFEFCYDLKPASQRLKIKVELSLEPCTPCDTVLNNLSRTIDNSNPCTPQVFTEFDNCSQASSNPFLDSSDDLRRLLINYSPEFSIASSPSELSLASDKSWPSSCFDNLAASPSCRQPNVTEVYVDGLPFEATREDIHNLFSLAGDVLNVTCVKSGCAFILFTTPDAAQRAIEAFNLKVMPGFEKIRKPMRVSESRRQEDLSLLVGKHLHVMNVPAKTTRTELFEYFSQCGPVTSVRLPPVRNSTSNNKGYGFVTFKNPESARIALKVLSGRKLPGYEVEANPLVLDYAKGCKPSDLSLQFAELRL